MVENKRGDITITVLVIGIIALCILAIVSFYISSLNTSDNFEGISSIEKVVAKAERGVAYDSEGAFKESIIDTNWFSQDKILFEVKYTP